MLTALEGIGEYDTTNTEQELLFSTYILTDGTTQKPADNQGLVITTDVLQAIRAIDIGKDQADCPQVGRVTNLYSGKLNQFNAHIFKVDWSWRVYIDLIDAEQEPLDDRIKNFEKYEATLTEDQGATVVDLVTIEEE